MIKAYIILAHKNEHQIKKLITSLDDGHSEFFIHLDLNSYLNKNNTLFNGLFKPYVHKVQGVKTNWGGFGLVRATLNAMADIKNNGKNFERIILLSGQDYPLKDNAHINDFFRLSSQSIFMDHCPLPNYSKWRKGGGLYRTNKYFFGFSYMQKYGARTLNFLAIYIKALRRKLGDTMQHYYGSQWWIMDMYTLNYVLDFVAGNPAYSLYHKYTFAPDELFFQTILLNTTDEKISRNILNDNKMFLKWKDEASAHPEVLTTADYELIAGSDALFARKFDTKLDNGVLELIDVARNLTGLNNDQTFKARHFSGKLPT